MAVAVSREQVRAAAAGVAVTFGLNGVGVATWFARVPTARDALGLTPAALGLLLLSMSVGAFAAMLTAGEVTHRLRPKRAVAVAAVTVSVGLAVAGIGIGAFPSPVLTGIGIFTLGYGSGLCDVAMNVEAAEVERALAKTVMPRFHAMWSLGTVVAAGLASFAAWALLPVTAHLGVVALVVAVGTLFATRTYRLAGEAEHGGGSGVLAAWREPRTLLIGLLVLVLAFTEGTANDWVGVAFVDGYDLDPALGAAVFGVFVTTMTFGRVFGTIALDRWGRVPAVGLSIVLAAAGVALAVFASSPVLAVVGVGVWGLGTALGFPVGMSAAADDPERAAARVSVVAVIGYTAFLAGPPLVGFLGNEVGVLKALLIVPVLLLPALALTPMLKPVKNS
ncbi:Fucose permease [Lentzea fradiae]|uniref:Fucose permease n=1 Tax=Lentzea fradiae TaxID=200378 RepID=A0A1G7VJW3_9PSEU|nr:MFS transporter [Lentzea fradiae]SDG59977.1 Fucose permease [Lentzea fradiae]